MKKFSDIIFDFVEGNNIQIVFREEDESLYAIMNFEQAKVFNEENLGNDTILDKFSMSKDNLFYNLRELVDYSVEGSAECKRYIKYVDQKDIEIWSW